MKKSTKAACLSLFVFPGVGLLWLKHWARGLLFFIPALISIIYIGTIIFKIVFGVREKYARILEENPQILNMPDLIALFTNMYKEVLAQLLSRMDTLHTFEYFFIACWICSAFSSYFVSLQIEKDAALSANTKE